MRSKFKKATNWLIIIIISAIAFNAGLSLRKSQYFHLPIDTKDLQASALIKLTPEWSQENLQTSKASDTEDRQLFRNVYNLVKANYVDQITPEMETNMARGAVRGMIESLNDTENRFMDPTERKLLDDAGNGRFYGIGAIITLKHEKISKPNTQPASKDQSAKLDIMRLIVIAPMPGSPAEKAGLKPGDSITHINKKWIITADPFLLADLDRLSKAVRNKEVDIFDYRKAFDAAEKKLNEGLEIPKALEMLTAQSTGEIEIKVERNGSKQPIDIKLQCTDTYVDPVSYKLLDDNIGYIKIAQFSKSASMAFTKEISRFNSSKAKALILDLRNNPGGLINSGSIIAGKMTGGTKLGVVIENTRRRTITMPKSAKLNKPIVVLMNKGTASVAEMVAASLKSYNNAVFIGGNTFGDGLTQTPIRLKDGSAAVITTGRMITAEGTDFNGKGLKPDMLIADFSDKEDTQLTAAQKYLTTKLSGNEKAKVN